MDASQFLTGFYGLDDMPIEHPKVIDITLNIIAKKIVYRSHVRQRHTNHECWEKEKRKHARTNT